MKLTTKFIKEGITKPGRYSDDMTPGLYVFAQRRKTMAGKYRLTVSYVQRLTIHGVRRDIGLGSPQWMTLTEARAAAAANYRIARKGGDPLADRRKAKVPTFREAANLVLEMYRPTWSNRKHPGDWIGSLERHAFPKLGSRTVDTITTADVLGVLVPIWNVKRETATRVRQRIGSVMKWAIAEGHRDDNPAGEVIGAALPKNGRMRKHLAALPYYRVSNALSRVQASGAYRATKLAFEFLVLTAARSGEVRGARWDEIDIEAAIWTVPSERMKRRRPHRVPLSPRALEVLADAREISDGSDLVFPSITGRIMSDMTISKLVKGLGIQAVPHGFRTSFRTWAAERTNIPREICEEALAHVNPNRVEAAYQRSDLFERRRDLMDAWARYLSDCPDEVVDFGARR